MKALLLIDIQNDFSPSGSLPVPGGDEIIPLVNKLQETFDFSVATQDWHPKHHMSFASSHENKNPGEVITYNGGKQILWPDHCVQNTKGAEFIPGLHREKIRKIIRKGTDPHIDSYSGFFDNGKQKATGLETYLRENEIDEVYITGLALDVCVKFTALDAVALGFKTHVILDACRGVNLNKDDVETSVKEMENAGVIMM